MPPEEKIDVCPAAEGETTPMLGITHAEDLEPLLPERKQQPRWCRLETKHVVKLLVLVDMFSVALVVPLLSSYFRDLSIRYVRCEVIPAAQKDAVRLLPFSLRHTRTSYVRMARCVPQPRRVLS